MFHTKQNPAGKKYTRQVHRNDSNNRKHELKYRNVILRGGMWVQQRGEQSELGETTVSEAQSKLHVLPNVHCVEEPLEAGFFYI